MFEDEKKFDKVYKTIINENVEKLEAAKEKVISEIIWLIFQECLTLAMFLFCAYEFRDMPISWGMLAWLLIIARY